MTRILAVCALVPAAATPYFWAFWTWLSFWRRHVVLTFAMMLGTIAAWTVVAIVWRDELLAPSVAMPIAARVVGWTIVALAFVVGTIADRQIGFRVRSFMPYFTERGRIELVTTGAYAIVRHPIYAAGLWFQLGMVLVTGAYAIAAAAIVFGLGAVWFTRCEERALVTLLADPSTYDRYRARTPALIPFLTGLRRDRSGP
jgi:protein-S-isoprenylcysteine O-methyltransferase Ste14